MGLVHVRIILMTNTGSASDVVPESGGRYHGAARRAKPRKAHVAPEQLPRVTPMNQGPAGIGRIQSTKPRKRRKKSLQRSAVLSTNVSCASGTLQTRPRVWIAISWFPRLVQSACAGLSSKLMGSHSRSLRSDRDTLKWDSGLPLILFICAIEAGSSGCGLRTRSRRQVSGYH